MPEPKLANQVFPLLTASKCNVTVGADLITCNLVHCVSDGTIAVTFSDGTGPTNITMVEGQDFAFPKTATIAITSGTYHVA